MGWGGARTRLRRVRGEREEEKEWREGGEHRGEPVGKHVDEQLQREDRSEGQIQLLIYYIINILYYKHVDEQHEDRRESQIHLLMLCVWGE